MIAHKVFVTQILRTLGIFNGKKAFSAPETVQIILINNCNLNCVVCPIHSDHLKQKKELKWKQKKQDFETIKKVISELSEIGVKEILLNADGEPFLYNQLKKLIIHIKLKGLKCNIITNGTLLNKKKIEELQKLKLDRLIVSLWAGDAKTYSDIHPEQTGKTFTKIKECLLQLKELKRTNRIPQLSISNTIFNKNYENISQMIKFAEEIDSDYVEFRIAGLLHELRKFELSKHQKETILISLKKINKNKPTIKNNLQEFQKAISFSLNGSHRMDRGIPNKIPCYAGWYYSKIDVDGNVHPCINCNNPMGNIKNTSFKKIWHSKEYNKFRKLAKQKYKGSYFKNYLCNQHCCLYIKNLSIYKKLNPFKKQL
ncbi:MAG: radical SAM protein [Nanoarchaeota archaeon]|nr:radical SAM protein [Nanoarchaeota archaeon]MCG2718124.1 radical SAM protein [Nanoarchaeota archaeon]